MTRVYLLLSAVGLLAVGGAQAVACTDAQIKKIHVGNLVADKTLEIKALLSISDKSYVFELPLPTGTTFTGFAANPSYFIKYEVEGEPAPRVVGGKLLVDIPGDPTPEKTPRSLSMKIKLDVDPCAPKILNFSPVLKQVSAAGVTVCDVVGPVVQREVKFFKKTCRPTRMPTKSPTQRPTTVPTQRPTTAPTGAPTSAFNIVLVNANPADTRLDAFFQAAVNTWQGVIVRDAPDVPNNPALDLTAARFAPNFGPVSQFVDDIVIYYRIAPIDGAGTVLGRAGPTRLRTAPGTAADGTPFAATMEFDTVDVTNNLAFFQTVILHEMGHCLGFTQPNFVLRNCYSAPCVPASGAAITYTCPRALLQFPGLGCTATAQLLMETTLGAGSDCSHWSETAFNNELMTPQTAGTVDPLSAITVGAMEDIWGIGSVNYAQAQPFSNCRRNLAASTNGTENGIPGGYVEALVPVNIDEVLMNRADAGIPITQSQMDLLPEDQQIALGAEMQAHGAQLLD